MTKQPKWTHLNRSSHKISPTICLDKCLPATAIIFVIPFIIAGIPETGPGLLIIPTLTAYMAMPPVWDTPSFSVTLLQVTK